jgi:hypothetical protein
MTTSQPHHPIVRLAIVPIVAVAVFFANSAVASQGPGGGEGTASHFTQLAMSIVVYGTCAILILCGLIGAARRHSR